jgi:sterol 3beta-glucosyltransferase
MQTWGSDGDIHPLIALAGGLAAAGHEVTLAITSAERKSYEPYAKRLGFGVLPVGFIGKSDEDMFQTAYRMHQTSNPLEQVRVVIHDMLVPGVDSMFQAAQALCADNDLIIGHFILHATQAAAEMAGKPYVTVTLNHSAIPTRETPPPMVPNLGGPFNKLAWRLTERIVNRVLLPPINQLRREQGLRPARSFRDVWESPGCNLIAVSPEFCPPKGDWGEHQQVCGFLNLPGEARPWEMDGRLAQFLEAGPPPVYMTFGSMLAAVRDPHYVVETTRLLVEAARVAGCRAILQSAWDVVSGIPEHPEIYRIETTPHPAVFPHCAAVVHHGGAGTTQTATLCGCPSIVVQHITDQFFWGSELKRLGVAPKPIDRRSATPAKIGGAVRRVLDDPSMRQRARRLGARMSAENGVQRAVEIIQRMHVTD